jgi:putative restriction endonuclease
VKLYVAITDSDWFNYLSELRPDEVNFWQPSASGSFRALSPGEPLLFKLHSPENYIVGGGFFSHYAVFPVSFAWATFGPKNGATTEAEMRSRLERYRRIETNKASAYLIGCVLLQSPFFFSREEWIPVPGWSREIVRGKGYTTEDEIGRRLWNDVELRVKAGAALVPEAAVEEGVQFGQPQVVMPRLGQGAFRVIVTDIYKRQCAVTNSHVLHVLDAAHIRPVAEKGSHSPSNGLLLRQDVHTLFDRGYLTVTSDFHLEVSRRLKEEFDNGKEYYALQGRRILLPEARDLWPSKEQLVWHNQNIYRP